MASDADGPGPFLVDLPTGKFEDITFFCKRNSARLPEAAAGKAYSYDGTVTVQDAKTRTVKSGRGMVASCFGGDFLSITLRCAKDVRPTPLLKPYCPVAQSSAAHSYIPPDKKAAPGFLFARQPACHVLCDLLLPPNE